MKLRHILESKTYAIRPQGKGEKAIYRLIDRETHDMHNMFFDTADQASDWCKKNGCKVDNSSMDD